MGTKDKEFLGLWIIKEVQEDDPLKTAGEENTFLNSMIAALLLPETAIGISKKKIIKTDDGFAMRMQ